MVVEEAHIEAQRTTGLKGTCGGGGGVVATHNTTPIKCEEEGG